MLTQRSKEVRQILHGDLQKFHQSSDMGASYYSFDERAVTIKHRLRKDKAAVVSFGMWVDGSCVWFQTTALPSKSKCKEISKIFTDWLEQGTLKAPVLPDYPGYEDSDKKTLKCNFGKNF